MKFRGLTIKSRRNYFSNFQFQQAHLFHQRNLTLQFSRSFSFIYSFGNGEDGQTGQTAQVTPFPFILPNFNKQIISIDSKDTHTFVITKENEIYFWGKFLTHQSSIPTQIPWKENLKLVQVSTSQSHSLLLTACGKVFSFGSNIDGQLGYSDCDTTLIPRLIKDLPSIKKVACGWSYSLALATNGDVYSWGSSHTNQLGHNTIQSISKPSKIQVLKSKKIRDIAGSVFHSIFLTSQNELLGVGRNSHGQLGIQPKQSLYLIQTFNEEITTICSGMHHIIAKTEKGQLFGIGRNTEGQLGVGNFHSTNQFILLPTFVERKIKLITTGSDHNIAVDSENKVWSWGKGSDFQCGSGIKEIITTPIPVQKVPSIEKGLSVQYISAGSAHSVLVVQ